MIGLAVTAAIIFLLLPICLSVWTLSRHGRLKAQLERLERRVAQLQASSAQPPRPPEAERDMADIPEMPDETPDAETPADEADASSHEPPGAERPIPEPAAQAALDAPPRQVKQRAGMEQALGGKWSVWIGGLALALGGVFLVRHSIEQGYLTPAVRIFLSALFAGVLCAAGEFLRRREIKLDVAGVPSAHIPGILTAAGIMTAFGTVFGAYALYGFIGPMPAFILLGAVSFAALVLAALHGPILAALGLIGGMATPALVASDQPSAWALFVYLLFVTGATYVTARLRNWALLAISAGAGATAWGLIWLVTAWSPGDAAAMSVYVAGLLVLTVFILNTDPDTDAVSGKAETPDLPWSGTDWITAGIMAGVAFLAFAVLRIDNYSEGALILFAIVAGLFIALAWQRQNLDVLVPCAAIYFLLAYAAWHIPAFEQLDGVIGVDKPFDFARVDHPGLKLFLLVGLGFGAAFALAGLFCAIKRNGNLLWTGTSAAAPLAIFGCAYLRATGFEHSVPFGLGGLALAALGMAAAEYLNRTRRASYWGNITIGFYTLAALGALAVSLAIFLEKGWLTIALALMVPAIAWVATARDILFLRPAAGALAALIAVRLFLDPRIVGDALGSTPIYNWLLYGYGVPAVAFGYAAWQFKRQRDGLTVQVLEGAAIFLSVLLVSFELRHWLHAGDMFAQRFDLVELALNSLTWLGFSLGLQKLYGSTTRPVVTWAGTGLGLLGFAAILLGHLFWFNPLVTNDAIGSNLIFNDLLLAYALPAVLCAAIYQYARGVRPAIFVKSAGILALVLMFAYLSLEVRTLFQGSQLAHGATTDTESYTYSAIWLVFGLVLLGAGVVRQSASLRYAALPILVLTILKVFLFDMSNLTGVLRAGSFIGLGLTLIAIGYVYQKVLIPAARGDDAVKESGE